MDEQQLPAEFRAEPPVHGRNLQSIWATPTRRAL